MQTLRKLPSSKPNNPKKMQGIMGEDHSNSRGGILKPIVYIVEMSSERPLAADSAALFAEAVSIMARLRGPDGCPWDREQSFDTIRKYTLEESYEVFDAIERRNWPDLCEELGDLLLQVLFYAQMASEAGYFTMADVIAGLNRKLVRRHPHVFGEEASIAAGNAVESPLQTDGIDASQVLRNWDAIKRSEKAQPVSSALDGIPRGLPALLEAAKLGGRAHKSGFDWPDVEGVFAKLEEETEELRQAIGASSADTGVASEEIVSEVGDMLFTMVNLARRLQVEPEFALRHTNAKFRRRFAAMEAASAEPLDALSAAQLESLWSQAKLAETAAASSPR
jgi:ATP diphosphatase